jgi:chemotaxis protein methyltransferase CheR
MAKYTLTDEQFTQVSALLLKTAGLHFDQTKRVPLQSHLRDRVQASHAADVAAYLALLQDPERGQAELHRLIESVVIHETSFFRNKEHFTAINTIALPALAQQPRAGARARRLRIWSAGCATGEEPYSLAITCLEHPALAGWKIEILATDVSARVLDLARQGVYSSDALRYVAPECIARWFTPLDEPPPARPDPPGRIGPRPGKARFRVVDEVRNLITFRRHNLAAFPYDPAVFADFDLLLCENVLIYFNPQVIRQTAEAFYRSLCPGGYLFLGYSETLWRVSTAFTLVTTAGTFFYQRPLAGAAETPAAPANGAAPVRPPRPVAPPAPAALPPLRVRPLQPAPPPSPPPPPIPNGGANVGAAVARNPAGVTLAREKTRQGRDLLEAGRYGEARSAFESALGHYPAAVDALVGLAQIHANQGDPERAMVECRRALDLDALCEDAHLLLGLLYRQQDQLVAAIDHFLKAIYINFESVPAHFHLAELYRTQGARADAAREYRRTLWALQQHPAHEPIGALPPALILQVCEQQLRRLHDAEPSPRATKGAPHWP